MQRQHVRRNKQNTIVSVNERKHDRKFRWEIRGEYSMEWTRVAAAIKDV